MFGEQVAVASSTRNTRSRNWKAALRGEILIADCSGPYSGPSRRRIRWAALADVATFDNLGTAGRSSVETDLRLTRKMCPLTACGFNRWMPASQFDIDLTEGSVCACLQTEQRRRFSGINEPLIQTHQIFICELPNCRLHPEVVQGKLVSRACEITQGPI